MTDVVPIGNIDPLVGVQLVEMGDAPPTTVGVPNTTGAGCPVDDTRLGDAGHEMRGGSPGDGPIGSGVFPQPVIAARLATASITGTSRIDGKLSHQR